MSSRYEDLKREYAGADPEQKLRILRHELLRPILTVDGVAALLRQIDPQLAQKLPADVSPAEFEQLLKWLSEASLDLHQILDALAPERHEH